jgi:hypothetical protein
MLSSYTFLVPDTFQSELTVIRPRGAVVLFDNMAVADSLFARSGSAFEVARVPLMRGTTTTGASPHTVKTMAGPEGRQPNVGIMVRGMDGDCSYGYMGGLSVQVLNPVE